MRITDILLLSLMGICLCSCKSGWPAIPLQSEKDGFVEAMRTDAQGREVSRLERRYKFRTWQFLCSPEGPVQRDYEIWDRLYEVTEGRAVRIPFQSVRGEPDEESNEYDYYIFYEDYFPVGQNRWVGLKYCSTGEGWDTICDLSMMVFDKQKIITKFMIPAVVEQKGIESPPDPWKLDEQNKQLLRIDTLNDGTVVFDLQTGEFVTGQNLVTKLPIGK